MTATHQPPRPDPTRSGAVWVTGMGAFLLLAAAAVFTAVRWDQIPDAAKLATLVAATGGFLIVGRTLKPTLPATAGALFHLGAFLVPIDVAAIGVRAELGWSTMLLAQGLVATTTFAWAAATERSVVLRWASAAAVVALAGGIGATTAAPAPLVLAAAGLVALTVGREVAAGTWAAIAGTAPLLATLDLTQVSGAGTLEALGLTGDQPRAVAALTGVVAAIVLGTLGHRRRDLRLALLGTAVAATGVLASWTAVERSNEVDLLGLATAFALVEALALVARHDPFWHRPAGIVAGLTEVLSLPAMGLLALLVPFADELDPTAPIAVAAAIAGLGWLAADVRLGDERPSTVGLVGRRRPVVGMAVAATAGIALATGSASAAALALVAAAAVCALVPHRRGAAAVAVVAASAAPAMASTGGWAAAAAAGLAGTVVVTELAVRRSQHAKFAEPADEAVITARAWLLALAALAPGAWATGYVVTQTSATAAVLALAAMAASLVAAQADRGRAGPLERTRVPFGTVARLGGLSVLAAVGALRPIEAAGVAGLVGALSVLEALRLREPLLAVGAAVALPVAVAGLSLHSNLSLPSTGVALTVTAAVVAGLFSHLGGRWAAPVSACVGLCIGAGIVLAAGDPTALADAMVVTGGIGLAAAVLAGSMDAALLAGVVITGGSWLRLAAGEVGASEPYLLPVTALLLATGMRSRGSGTSSWIAYGPCVGLLGGSALVERMAGGPGWHAVAAGAVGVVAVAVGGARRLAAPLLVGSALLVVLVGYETLAVTTALPTWTWLAVGGTALLGAGVAMERHDVGPLETGRRLVDVVSDRYS